MAKVAMATKRRLEKPTPAVVRATLPRTCVNPTTQAPASNWTLYNIFHTLCYDEVADDPWVYLHSPSKDFLSEEMKRSRRTCAQHIRDTFSQGSWPNHVAIDPCIYILASSRAQSDEQKVAAMGGAEDDVRQIKVQGTEPPSSSDSKDSRARRRQGPLDTRVCPWEGEHLCV